MLAGRIFGAIFPSNARGEVKLFVSSGSVLKNKKVLYLILHFYTSCAYVLLFSLSGV